MTRDNGNRSGGRGGKPGGSGAGGAKSGGFRSGGPRPGGSGPGGSRPGGARSGGGGKRFDNRADRPGQGYQEPPAEVKNTGSGGEEDWFARPSRGGGAPGAGRSAGGKPGFGKPGSGRPGFGKPFGKAAAGPRKPTYDSAAGRFVKAEPARADAGQKAGGKSFSKSEGRGFGKGAGRPGSPHKRRDDGYAKPGWNPAAEEKPRIQSIQAAQTADAEWGDLWDGGADDNDADIDWAAIEAEAAGSAPAGFDDYDDDDADEADAEGAGDGRRQEQAAPQRKPVHRTAAERAGSGGQVPGGKGLVGRAPAGTGILVPGQKARIRAGTTEALATGVQTLIVEPDETDMRLDRFLTARFPQLAFTHIQRIVRKGELRVDGGRVKPNDRLKAGQSVRIPPLKLAEARPTGRTPRQDEDDATYLRSLILYEDKDLMVLNKPMGLAVQGGSGTHRHVDGMLEALRDKAGQKPRLVHRLDKDTAGCLVIAKTRLAAATLGKSFKSRVTRKVYWALVAGVPRVKQGRISTYIAKEEDPDGDSRMGVAAHGDDGASHAVTYYALVENSAQKVSWVSLKPVTGRTHQLRVHTAHMGHPIVGDPKYFNVENWEVPGGIQKKLHLLARRIVIPHPRDGRPIDVTAPLPPHMAQTWNLLGFDTSRYDPIVESPEE